MLYEIINPSDPYTMECERFDVASAAILFLGEGRYAGRCGDDTKSVPLFFFGGAEKWFKETHGVELGEFLAKEKAAIGDALANVAIGSVQDRTDFNAAVAAISDLAARQRFIEERHDHRRSSMNNIGKRAMRLAEAMRKSAESPHA